MATRTLATRILLALALIFLAAYATPSSWAQGNAWDKDIKAAENAYVNGLKEKYGPWVSFYVGNTPRSLANFTKAEQEILAALAQTQAFPAGDLRTANTLSGLASVYLEEGKFAEAEERQKQSIATAEISAGPDDPQLAKSLVNLAMLYSYDSKCEQATPIWNRSLAILKKAGKVDLEWLSKVELRIQTSGESLACQELSAEYILKLREFPGASEKDLRISLVHLAVFQRGPDAERDYARILEIDKKTSDPDALGTNNDVESLAKIYADEGKYAAEVVLLQPISESSQQPARPSDSTLTKDSDEAALLRLNRELARAYTETGKYSEAEELYKRIIARDEADTKFSRDVGHMDLSDDLVGLSRMYRLEHRYDEALDTIKRSETIDDEIANSKFGKLREKSNAPSIWLWLSQIELAEIYREKGDTAAAEPLFHNTVEVTEQAKQFVAPGDTRLAHLLDNYGSLLRDEGKYDEAETYYKRALNAWAKNRYPEQPDVAQTLTNYAVLLRKIGRPAEAEPLEARASTILKRASAPDTSSVTSTDTSLGGPVN